MTINKLFFNLIRVAIGTENRLLYVPSSIEWESLYAMSKKQSLIGVCFAGIQRLGADADSGFSNLGMSEMQYLTWMGMAAKIQQKNELMNASTKKALELFRNAGFECTTLKGQGIAELYGPLAGLRQSGDIDIWVHGGRKELYDYSLKSFGKLAGLTYHHIHFPSLKNAEIEAHTWPSFLASPIRNNRLQEFCKINATKEDTPSLAFNRVFILLHCYQHFTRRGVGMRQLLDYYFVLQQGFTAKEREETMYWIERLGMLKFCQAMMWIIANVFEGSNDSKDSPTMKSLNPAQDKSQPLPIRLLCAPNEEYGSFLLDEVMQTGNMGHTDERVNHKHLQSPVGRYLFNLKRDYRIVKICNHEALWEPLWGIYQFVWCKLTQIKYKRKI